MKNLLPLKEAFEVLGSDMLFHINCGTRSVGEILIGFTLEIFLHIVARYYLVIIVFSNRRFFFLFVCLFLNQNSEISLKKKVKVGGSLKMHLQKSYLPNISSLALAEKSIPF